MNNDMVKRTSFHHTKHMVYIGDLAYEALKNRLLAIENEEKQALLTLIYLTGSRVGEITEPALTKTKNPPLSWQDIKIIPVGQSNKKMMEIQIKVEKSKEARFRKIYINLSKEKELAKVIWKWREEIRKHGKHLGVTYLFPSRKSPGRGISTRTAERWFQEYFPEFHEGIHHLRHWRITHYLSGAVTGKKEPKDIVGKLVGHTTLSTTNIYDHVAITVHAEDL